MFSQQEFQTLVTLSSMKIKNSGRLNSMIAGLDVSKQEIMQKLKTSILRDMDTLHKIIYQSPRFEVSLSSSSKISIYDIKTKVQWRIQDVKDNPKMFTKALVKKLPFFELYEKT